MTICLFLFHQILKNELLLRGLQVSNLATKLNFNRIDHKSALDIFYLTEKLLKNSFFNFLASGAINSVSVAIMQ